MKPIIVKNSKVPKMMSLVINVYAITLWPFIFIRDDGDERVIRHESIHIKQYNELFVVGFLILYLYDWIKGLIKYRSKAEAYYNIRFEQEAYMYDVVDGYLENRSKYEWRKFNV
jgi:hypothetical protein